MGRGDDYVFKAGDVHGHNIVIATLPAGQEYGTGSAAALASQIKKFFPNLWFGLLVGVAAGLPNLTRSVPLDIRLGDILVGLPSDESAGLVAYELAKVTGKDGYQLLRGGRVLANTETVVRSAIGSIKLNAPNESEIFLEHYECIKHHEHPGGTFIDPGQDRDTLYEVAEDDIARRVARERRPASKRTRVWYGSIGSGDKLVKNAQYRDMLRNELNLIGLEMEAAGTMNQIPVGVIRGVCDYADNHKNKEWQPYAAAMAAAYAKAVLAEIGPRSIAAQNGPQDPQDPKDPIRSAKEINILKMLNTSLHHDRKDRNTDSLEGTCGWFVSHEFFRDWQESKSSRLLWVSADPGCGKSVLSKYLVDHVLKTTVSRTVCYFFFKDDFEDQRNVMGALRCILYQLFDQKRNLLSDSILEQSEIKGENLFGSFGEIWRTLISVAEDENAGEIICLLDAIDECEDQGRSQLARELRRFYSREGTGRTSNLKFLLTSRPYDKIRRSFGPQGMPTSSMIHLSGENEAEMEKISREIDIFIKDRVKHISGNLLTHEEQDALLRQLTRIPHRTYLWVHLTLNLIERDIDKLKTVGVASQLYEAITEAISNPPRTVDEAYNKALSKSPNPEHAKDILHIIVAAQRPLTVKEMNMALNIQKSIRSYEKVNTLEDENNFRQRIRDTCGLFVTIIDSKLYLLHQTVKEFLVQNDELNPGSVRQGLEWKHSIQPIIAHRVLAEICVYYLLFEEFEVHPLDENEVPSQYADNHIFLAYSAMHWAAHLRELGNDVPDAMQQSVLKLCDMSSRSCLTWLRIYWTNAGTEFPSTFTSLMIASYFGLETVAKQLLSSGVTGLNSRDDTYGRSALSWAAGNGFYTVVKLLIGNTTVARLGSLLRLRADINSKDNFGRTPLSYAVWSGNTSVVELLIKAGSRIDLEDTSGGTPLSSIVGPQKSTIENLFLSAARNNDEVMVRLFLDREADLNSSDDENRTRLLHARDANGNTALHWAIYNANKAMMSVILNYPVNLEARAGWDNTPLISAIEDEFEIGVRMLLDRNCDVNYWCKPVSVHKPEVMASLSTRKLILHFFPL
ncbi:hypothetical protein F4861DRAFT_530286 [Xylaria intraflava]|nr:hypothetical protein F4861DRAFT_530286 [Xylaria intraflava]